MLQPIDELLDERVDAGTAGIEPEMRLLVGRAPLMIQAFESRSIGGERPAAIGRHAANQPVERYVEPDRDAVGVDRRAVLHVGERAAAGRDDDVAGANLVEQNLSFDVTEV